MDRRASWRQQIHQLYQQLGGILDSLDTALPTFAGVVYRHRTRCGKPRCVCRQGQLHAAWCVSWVQAGRKHLRTIPPAAVEQLRTLAQRYRRLRRGRAQSNQTYRKLLGVLDRLERSLRVPPSRALRWARGPKGRA